MPISAYTGLPRHGKSYGVVENVIAPALKSGRQVFSNIPMHDDKCLEHLGMTVDAFDIQDLLDNPSWFKDTFVAGSLLVIDEAWRLWPSGLKTNAARDCDKELLAEHGHMVGLNGKSTEIIIVTQDLSQIATFVRALIETTYRVTKLSNVGMSNSYRVDVYFGAVMGTTPPKSKRTKEIFGKFKKSTYELYVSHTQSETGEAGNEDQTDSRFNILTGKKLKYSLAFMVVLAFISYQGIASVFSSYGVAEPAQPVQPLQTQSVNKVSKVTQVNKEELKAEYEKKLRQELDKIQKKKESELLYLSEYIEISFNNGLFPDIDYLFKVVYNNSDIEMPFKLLQQLGYKVEPISKCLVRISSDTYEGYAKCYPQETETNFFTELTQ